MSATPAPSARYRLGSPSASGAMIDAVRSAMVASGPTLISRTPPMSA